MDLSPQTTKEILHFSIRELTAEKFELLEQIEILQKQNDSLEHQLMRSLDQQDRLRAELTAYKYRLSEMMRGWT